MQTAIPAIFMRGGTSRGLYFNKADLPEDRSLWDGILLAAFGSPDPRQVDGVGGTTSVTSKTCIISPSEREDCDVDYFFAQVSVDDASVDYGPTCGNMLAGVGPYAIETGLVPVEDGETRVRIHQVNTGGKVEAVIQTPGGHVEFEGDAAIDGVPGTGAPILLNFMDAIGSYTDQLFPTGKPMEQIDGIDVTLVDAAMPVMIMRAEDIGKTGYETAAELAADDAFFARVSSRCAAKRAGAWGWVMYPAWWCRRSLSRPHRVATAISRHAILCPTNPMKLTRSPAVSHSPMPASRKELSFIRWPDRWRPAIGRNFRSSTLSASFI